MKTEADKLRNSIQYGLGVMDSGSGEFKELSNKIDELFELSYLEGQSSPKIKQLKWVKVYKSIFNADTSFKYTYEIHVNDDGSTILFGSSARKPKRFINLKEAQSEAQADFEKRVKECLNL